MENIVIQLIARWGITGLLLAASCYIIWDSWRKNKKNEEWCKEVMLKETHAIGSRSEISRAIETIRTDLQQIAGESSKFRKEINNRIAVIEDVIANHHPTQRQKEADRMEAVAKIAPSINTILLSTLDDCNLDHVALALLHNGTQSVAGIPYIKVGVIAEKFKLIDYPSDVELVNEYKDEDIIKYNKLPAAIIQSGYISFDINNDDSLAEIDYGTFNRCKTRGIKHVAFVTINDSYGLCTGCVIAYNFTDTPINQEELTERAKVIENLYQTMLKGFE